MTISISNAELCEIASKIRSNLIVYSQRTKTPHLASCLSSIDILVSLYFDVLNISADKPNDQLRDYFILSKGHAAPALFHVLAEKGFIKKEDLDNACHDGTDFFGEHPPAHGLMPGNEFATGSLGHGLPLGVGIAFGCKIQSSRNRIFCLLGDGECNEGSVWEAAALAANRALKNLIVIVDCNKWQGTDRTERVLSNGSLAAKWSAFGWNVKEVDGHDIESIRSALQANHTEKPLAIMADTVKGKGVSFMEDDNNWHYKIPSIDEVKLSLKELGVYHAK